jgi:peptide/nickel transport system ATP-binding protein
LSKAFRKSRTLLQTLKGRAEHVKAIDGVTFEVLKGEVLGLVGESGSGKTTLGRVILRLEEPDSGSIRFEESDYTSVKDRSTMKEFRRKMQMIFQDPFDSINPRMNVRDVIEEPLRIHNVGSGEEERTQLIRRSLEDVRVNPPEDYLDRYPHELSGGQRQRIAIARTLVLKPSFIVADEPVSMLDVSVRMELLNLMLDLKDRYGLTYLFITHDLAVAKYVCDRIAVMQSGKIVELGPAVQIIHNPQHPYTKALRAAVPVMKPHPH